MKDRITLLTLLLLVFTFGCKKDQNDDNYDSFTIIQEKTLEGKYEGVFGGNYFCKTGDGGYAIFTRKFYSSVVLIKVDSNFNYEWERTYSGSAIAEHGIITTSDGNIASLSSYTDPSSSLLKTVQIEMIDTKGNLVWSFKDSIDAGVSSFTQGPDGSFFILCKKANSVEDTANIQIIKLSNIGEKIWTNVYPSSDKHLINSDIISTIDNNIVFVQSNYICKLSENGEKLWEDTLSNSILTAISSDPYGNILIIGQKRFHTQKDGFSESNFLIAKFDKYGNHTWEQDYNFGEFDLSLDICIGYDKTYIIPGTSYNPETGIIFKVDQNGNKFYEKLIALGRRDFCNSIIKSNGRYVLLGTYKGDQNDDSSTIYLMEFNF